MKTLFLIDPLAALKPYKDSSVAMMRAAQARGHRLFVTEPNGLLFRNEAPHVRAQEIVVTNANDGSWVSLIGEATIMATSAFDVVLERKDPPFDMEYVYRTYLLERVEAAGTRVWNAPRAVRDHNEKMAILKHTDMITPTAVSRDMEVLKAFHAEHRDTIFKPLDGMGGMGIFRVRADDPNLNVILETLTANGTRTIMAQRFLPEIVDGDKRILLIAGEVVPFALARIPQGNETRGNMAAGGKPVARPLRESDKRIAETIAARLWKEGLFLVGLDVIGERVTEINVTSPTGFVEITHQTGFDVAAFFVEKLEQNAREVAAKKTMIRPSFSAPNS
jgi:glutathione synthase